jgi:vitamin B12 transporter
MRHGLSGISALAILAAGAAQAQDPFDLGEITLFTNRASGLTDLARTGASVDVLTQTEIERAPSTLLAGDLARLPGVSVSGNGPLGTQTDLRIRGLDGKYVKVLIDGIDVTDPAGPQTAYNWGNLLPAGIGRVEVLKGSSSSINGSRAIAGVVNITSVRPTEPGTTLGLAAEYGSFNTRQGALSLGHLGDRGSAAVTLNRIESDGFSAADGAANREDDGYEATQINLTADFQATDTLLLGLSGYYLDAEGNFDEFSGDGAPPFDEFNTTENLGLRVFGQLETGAILHTLSASTFDSNRLSSSNGFDSRFDGDRQRIDYQAEITASETTTYTFGADWEEESFDSGSESGRVETTGIFGELLLAPRGDVDIAASLRYDDNSAFGGNLSGRLAAVYRLQQGTILRAVAATGFRAPSLFELNSTLYGNAGLDPENSLSFELGAEQAFANGLRVGATVFYTEVDDLIQFVTLTTFPDPFTGQYQQVPGTSVSQGLELFASYDLSDTFSLYGNYTYTDTEDANGDRLLRVPGHDLVVGLRADVTDRAWGTLDLRHVADRPDEFGTAMPDYTVVDASVGYELTENAEAYLRIVNLFDEDYQTAAGFSASDRAFYVGVRAAF